MTAPASESTGLTKQERWIAAGLSVLLLSLSFPPVNLRWLVLVGLLPMAWAISHPRLDKPFRLGYLFGFLWQLSTLHWLLWLSYRWIGNWPLAVLPWVGASAVCALYFAGFAWLASKWRDQGGAIVFALSWVAFEWLKGNLPYLAFPMGVLPTPLYPFPQLLSMAAGGDILLLTFFVALCGAVIPYWLHRKDRVSPMVLVGLLAFALLRPLPASAGKEVVVAAAQPGLDLAFGDRFEEVMQVGERVPKLVDAASSADLVVFPEGLVEGGPGIPPFTPFEVPSDVPIVFGGKRGVGPVYQSAFSFDGEWDFTDKTRLVVFGEYVPFRNWPIIGNFKLAPYDITPGAEVRPLSVAGLKAGVLICFEALFPDLARAQKAKGSQVLLVMSVDDWYSGTGAPELLKASTIFRAVETGLPVIRAGGLGYSLICDGQGRILSEAPYGDAAVTMANIRVGQ